MASGGSDGASAVKVLLYVPNLICYLRLGLLGASEVALLRGLPAAALWLFFTNFLLDAADGLAARRLHQLSAFGALLDVFVDNLSRAALWSRALPGLLGVLVPALESLCFACAHKAGGKAWKDGCFREAPPWVQAIMASNFRTPAGALAVAGLFGAPLWLWSCKVMPGHALCSPILGCLLLGARAVAGAVELWLLRRYLMQMIRSDE